MTIFHRRGRWAVKCVARPDGGYSSLLVTGTPGMPISGCTCVASERHETTAAAARWAEAQFAQHGA